MTNQNHQEHIRQERDANGLYGRVKKGARIPDFIGAGTCRPAAPTCGESEPMRNRVFYKPAREPNLRVSHHFSHWAVRTVCYDVVGPSVTLIAVCIRLLI